MGAQFKFNPCGCCSTPFSGVSTDCCNNVPSSFKGYLQDNKLRIGYPKYYEGFGWFYQYSGTVIATGIPSNDIKFYPYIEENLYPYFEFKSQNLTIPYVGNRTYWFGGLVFGSNKSCGSYSLHRMYCEDGFYGCTGMYLYTNRGNFVTFPTLPSGCSCNGQMSYYDFHQHADEQLRLYPFNNEPEVVTFENTCCPYLSDNMLSVWSLREFGKHVGNITKISNSNIFSGDNFDGQNYFTAQCAYDTNDIPVKWLMYNGTTGIYMNEGSYCYPFIPSFVNNTLGPNRLTLSRVDNVTVSGVPTLLTDSRLIPRNLYLTINPEDELAPRTYLPIFRESNYPLQTKIFNNPHTNLPYAIWRYNRPIAFTGDLISFGSGDFYLNLHISNPWNVNQDGRSPGIGGDRCLESAIAISMSASYGYYTGCTLISGTEVVSLDPLLLRNRYRCMIYELGLLVYSGSLYFEVTE